MEQVNGARPAYQLRLRHLLVPRAKLTVTCDACGAVRELDVFHLLREYGDLHLTKLAERLSCRLCKGDGRLAFAKLRIEWLSDPHAPGA